MVLTEAFDLRELLLDSLLPTFWNLCGFFEGFFGFSVLSFYELGVGLFFLYLLELHEPLIVFFDFPKLHVGVLYNSSNCNSIRLCTQRSLHRLDCLGQTVPFLLKIALFFLGHIR